MVLAGRSDRSAGGAYGRKWLRTSRARQGRVIRRTDCRGAGRPGWVVVYPGMLCRVGGSAAGRRQVPERGCEADAVLVADLEGCWPRWRGAGPTVVRCRADGGEAERREVVGLEGAEPRWRSRGR